MSLEDLREELETVRQGILFLNHAGVSPLPRRAVDAMHRAISFNQTLRVEEWAALQADVEACRRSLARLIHASPEEIALSRNTTESINWVANGMAWKPGDRVVTVRGEYPANIYPWMRLREKGVEMHLVEPVEERVSLEQIEAALTPNTRLLSLSWVEFASGFRIDLEAVGKLCEARGVLLLVDVIQGLGALPLDVKQARVVMAAGAAQKWLLGPVGAGFLYCDRARLDELEVTVAGADSVARPIPYLDYEYVLKPDARRFEYSTTAVHAVIGWGASLSIFLEEGMETVARRIWMLTEMVYEGAVRKGYKCHSPRGEGEWSGILSLTHPSRSVDSVIAELAAKRMFVREREGRIRLSPHFYQTENEMAALVEAL